MLTHSCIACRTVWRCLPNTRPLRGANPRRSGCAVPSAISLSACLSGYEDPERGSTANCRQTLCDREDYMETCHQLSLIPATVQTHFMLTFFKSLFSLLFSSPVCKSSLRCAVKPPSLICSPFPHVFPVWQTFCLDWSSDCVQEYGPEESGAGDKQFC